MNLIFFSRRQGKARHLNLSHPLTVTLVSVAALAVLAGVFALGFKAGVQNAGGVSRGESGYVAQQRAELAQLRVHLQEGIDGLALKMGLLNAHLIRLNALGKRLTQMANLSSREFDFDHDPAVGGPESDATGRGAQVPDLSLMINQFDRSLDFRTSQFTALENVLLGRQLSAEIRPSGKPVMAGYISSYFGERMDPFNGEEAFHKGLDFASEAGADVLAVAQGVVTWAGPREGYGIMIEINHGNGYVTRYAHNSRVAVAVGDTVERGQGDRRSRDRPAARPDRMCTSRCSETAGRSTPMAFIGH